MVDNNNIRASIVLALSNIRIDLSFNFIRISRLNFKQILIKESKDKKSERARFIINYEMV